CPDVELVRYAGDLVRFRNAARVFPAFRDRLPAFERIVHDVGIEVYGRPPKSIQLLGSYVCRRMQGHARWLSEHALGNAIDVQGSDFWSVPKDAKLPEGLPKQFANGFEVSVIRHWNKKTGHAAVHARFLRLVIQRLVDQGDVFNVLLGPGYPDHANHFHFDMA